LSRRLRHRHNGGVRELHVVRQDELPFSRIAHELEGHLHGGLGLSLIFVDAPPGRGPGLHRHDYDEVFIMQEGVATFTAGNAERELRAGDIAIVPAGMPHKFVNSGDGPLRQIDIHVSPRFDTEWLT
jgi:mannose-6-phosphate isomerase-like protein (cupin superfamily)